MTKEQAQKGAKISRNLDELEDKKAEYLKLLKAAKKQNAQTGGATLDLGGGKLRISRADYIDIINRFLNILNDKIEENLNQLKGL